MKALLLKKVGSPYELSIDDILQPEPDFGEVRIKVAFSSINPVDYKFAKGGSSLTLPHILGIDTAGIIDAVGPGVSKWKVGDRVFSMNNLLRWGGFAEFVVVNENAVGQIPDNLSFEAAATIPCAGITAWQAIYRKAHLEAGQKIVINGAGGGVGGFSVQLAKQLGATVYAIASSEPERIMALGADYVINYKQEDVYTRIMDLTHGLGVDVVIDMISSSASSSLTSILRHNGHMVSVSGRVDINPVPAWTKAISFHEVALAFAYQHGDTSNLAEIVKGGEYLAKLMAENKINPMINKKITLEDLSDELRSAEAGRSQGKTVIKVSGCE
ncbi:zinc-binding dehydrogenase [Aeromonas veronii]|uniref:zinc-binding dehydrogenase n=1 Tax=Aeromonas rivipollensis TaxID=948519 RepID=UPI0038D2C218